MRALVAALAIVCASCGGDAERAAKPATSAVADQEAASEGTLRRMTLGVKGRRLSVEVADTRPLRQRGLMARTALPDDAGMLFVFPSENNGGFWMKDTLIPLSIAYLSVSADGAYIVEEILDMEPCVVAECPIYPATAPYVAALEVNQGWYARHGVIAGDTLTPDGPRPTAAA